MLHEQQLTQQFPTGQVLHADIMIQPMHINVTGYIVNVPEWEKIVCRNGKN